MEGDPLQGAESVAEMSRSARGVIWEGSSGDGDWW